MTEEAVGLFIILLMSPVMCFMFYSLYKYSLAWSRGLVKPTYQRAIELWPTSKGFWDWYFNVLVSDCEEWIKAITM